jgi:two-component system response regulator PilR (NtrC family)
MPGRYHVLIVEDDRDLRTLYTIRLMHEGYQVTAVEDEACALTQVTAGNIDLVLTDWHLPTRSGVELITTLQRLHPTVKTIWRYREFCGLAPNRLY